MCESWHISDPVTNIIYYTRKCVSKEYMCSPIPLLHVLSESAEIEISHCTSYYMHAWLKAGKNASLVHVQYVTL